MSERATPSSARQRLARVSNTWFFWHEMEKAHALAQTASEDECQAELDRLEAVRISRIEAWRSMQ